MTKFSIRIFFCILIASSLLGCKSKFKVDDWHPLVVAHTSGTVSVTSPVRVVLTNDALRNETSAEAPMPGDPAPDGVFKFSPAVKGKAMWVNSSTIEFVPDKPFDTGREYGVQFRISKVVKVGSSPKNFNFTFTTIAPAFHRQLDGLRLYNRNTPNVYYLAGTVIASDFIPADDVQNLLTVKTGGRTLPVTWEHNFTDNVHVFRIDSIRASTSSYDITLSWDGQNVGFDYVNEDIITVPSENEFNIIDIQVINSPEQYIRCTFTLPIDDKQRLMNYFSLSSNANVRFAVDVNTVNIYPVARQEGVTQLTVHQGLQSTTGKKLEQTAIRDIIFEQLKPGVKFTGKGVILPNSDGLHVAFQAVNFRSVNVEVWRIHETNILQFLQINRLDGEWELHRVGAQILQTNISLSEQRAANLAVWNTFSIDLAKLIEPEPGAIYRVILEGDGKMIDEDDDTDWWEYYRTRNERMRNILASDIGLTLKTGDNRELFVIASNLVTAAPMSGVQLTAYNMVNQPIGHATTDRDGIAMIQCSESASVIIAQQGNQKTYLRVDNNSISLSNFDASGTSVQSGIKGFIYGERGVWRPGDTIFLAFMLEDKNRILPTNHPVNFTLFDPNNQIADRQVRTQGVNGLYRFTTGTGAEAITGNWMARIEVGGQTFTRNLKIETVKPNRLKIDLQLDQVPIYSTSGLTGKLSVNWLTGATARNLDVRINARISQMRTTFREFADFSFDDPSKLFQTEEKTLVEGKLNDTGEMTIRRAIDVSNSPGMLRMFISTRVFEEGGDFSIDEFSAVYSPFKSYIGIRAPKGDGYYNRLDINENVMFDVITVDETGRPVTRRGVDVSIYKVGWTWWWYSMRGNAHYYDSRYERPIFSTKIDVPNGRGNFSHIWTDSGYYILKMTDSESGHVTAIPVFASHPHWWDDEDGPSTATMLQLSTSKPSYNVGENAEITFPAAPGAMALVSIESGTNVQRAFWVECITAEGRVVIPTTAEMAPNVYVGISLIQPHAKTENDAPIRLFGVVPLMVEDPQTRLEPVIDMPNELRPEEAFTVKVSEKNRQTMTYTLAIVDDGLLDLTRFRTPAPWEHFYAREALGIKTWDIYDFVIGAYGGKIEQLFAVGGGDEGVDVSAQRAQRFLPVVQYLGPFTVERGRTNEHRIKLQPYIGSVRTMVIATNGRAFGTAEKTTPVRKPLMTLATMPRVVGPGEEIWLPVTVFAMADNIRQANVEIRASDIFTIEGGSRQNVSFSSTGDKTVYFKLKVRDRTGIGTITATVSGHNERAEHTIEIDVRNPNPTVYTFAESIVEGGGSWNGEFTLPGMTGTNAATLEVSTIPPINLGKRLHFLTGYPHGCLEQVTSKAFPQLFLNDLMELNAATRQNIETNIKAALSSYRRFVTSHGGFGYWQGATSPDGWATSYAGHFMLEAENKGYALPAGIKQSWLSFQTNRARNWRSNEGNDFEQAYRLYTLALAKQPDLSAMNRLMEYNQLSNAAKWRLAAAYALAGRPETARSLTTNLTTTPDRHASRFNPTFGSSERDMAMILETLTLLNERTQAMDLVRKLSEALNSNRWMSTQETAYSLLAVSKYAAGERGNREISLEYTESGQTQRASTRMPIWKTDLNVEGKTGVERVGFKNTGQTSLFVRITASGVPLPGEERANAHNLELSARFVNERRAEIDVSRLSQGTDFRAEVTVHNPGRMGVYTNLILSQIFPSGWEITNTRLNDDNVTTGQSTFDYIDIRDDRVYTYFSLNPGERKTFIVQLTAAYRGIFYLPAFSCEGMYDDSVRANNEGRWIEVVE